MQLEIYDIIHKWEFISIQLSLSCGWLIQSLRVTRQVYSVLVNRGPRKLKSPGQIVSRIEFGVTLPGSFSFSSLQDEQLNSLAPVIEAVIGDTECHVRINAMPDVNYLR